MISITKESIAFEELKSLIVERLKPLNPDEIILFRGNFFAKAKTVFTSFGSYAYGTPNEDSDIDLYIVTNDDFMPQGWREKSKVYLKYANQLNDIIEQYPTDLIVHTRKMYEIFLNMDSMFSRKIFSQGKIIL